MHKLPNRRAVKRFFHYALVGGSTFLFDLSFLYLLTEYVGIPTVPASGVSFGVSVTINYLISRRTVFRPTTRRFSTGYANFLILACMGIALTMSGMYYLETMLGVNYLLARILIACFVGMGNYLANLYFNFKVAGKY